MFHKFYSWSSEMPVCNPMTCGYPYVEDAKAVIQKSSYNIKASQGADINDKAIVVCSKGHHMLVNTSASTIAIRDHVQIVCSHDGVWEKDYPYKCLDQAALAQVGKCPLFHRFGTVGFNLKATFIREKSNLL